MVGHLVNNTKCRNGSGWLARREWKCRLRLHHKIPRCCNRSNLAARHRGSDKTGKACPAQRVGVSHHRCSHGRHDGVEWLAVVRWRVRVWLAALLHPIRGAQSTRGERQGSGDRERCG